MNTQPRVLAVVAARGGSKGLPGKNIRPLAGRPLVAWSVAAALGAECVSRVIVSTDDDRIADAARAAGADVPFMRPAHLAIDTASSMDVVFHALDTLEAEGQRFDYILLLEPTSPLTEASDVDAAFAALLAAGQGADAIIGVSEVGATHPEYDVVRSPEGLIKPFQLTSFSQLRRRQEIPSLYFLDGSLYLSRVEALRERGSFCHDRTLGYVMPKWKSFEVDDLVDFICIEALLANRVTLKSVGL